MSKHNVKRLILPFLLLISTSTLGAVLPVVLDVSEVDVNGDYSVSWAADFSGAEYVLIKTDSLGEELVVQRGGTSYAGMGLAAGDHAVFYLAEIKMLFSGNLALPIYANLSETALVWNTTLPSAPTLPASYDPNTSQNISWSAAVGATEYRVERRTDGGGWVFVDSSTTNSVPLPNDLDFARHAFRVIACVSAEVCAEPSAVSEFVYQDETAPAARDTNNETTYVYTYHPDGVTLETETMDGPRSAADVSDTTVSTFDVVGNLTQVENALDQVTIFENYNSRGQVGKITDANGVVTLLAYHPRGWLTTTTVKHPTDSSLDAITDFEYDAVGQLDRIILPDATFLDYEYDNARRLVAIENTLGERIEYKLDDAGNREKQVICNAAVSDADACDPDNPQNNADFAQTQVFDALSRLRKTIPDTASREVEYGYDTNDNLKTITDGRNNESVQNYDALDRLAQQIDPDADNSNLTDNPKVIYGYDDQDRITTVTDQEGLITDYQYDAFGSLEIVDSPDTGITTYGYDNAGNRVRQQDARGQVIIYRYDALNRLTDVTPVGAPDEHVRYVYDDTTDGNYGVGRLTKIIDQSGFTSYEYDHRGNIKKKSVTIDGIAYSTSYTYTLADRIETMTFPSGRVVTYYRDNEGRIERVAVQDNESAPQTDIVSNIAYKPFGPVMGYLLGNGIDRVVEYDQDYLLTDIDDVYNGTSWVDWGFDYDDSGNLDSWIDNAHTDDSRDQGFGYDRVNRLDTATGSYGGINYTYDGVGNRQTKVTTTGQSPNESVETETYTYDYETNGIATGSHQLDQVAISVDGSTAINRDLNYTAAGNLETDTKDDGSTVYNLSYNAHNRYTGLNDSGTDVAVYQHNALGQRVSKELKVSGTVTHYHYDESGQLIAETDAQGNFLREYIFVDAMRLVRFDGATAYYYHNDHLGRPVVMTDSARTVVWEAEYFPFGQVHVLHSDTADQTMGFPGQILDSESDFYYNYFRNYDPSTGKYLEADPIGILRDYSSPSYAVAKAMLFVEIKNSGLNHLYGYVDGNPINYIDPYGLDKCTCIATGGGNRVNGDKICTYNCSCIAPTGESYSKTIQVCEGDGDGATCKGQWEDPYHPNPSNRTGFDPFSVNTGGFWDNTFNSDYVEELKN